MYCTMILTSKHPNYPTSMKPHKCLIIAKVCFENPLSQIAILEENFTSICLPNFHGMWPISIPLVHSHTILPCLIQWFNFTFMPCSFYILKQLGSTCIAFNRYWSNFYDHALSPTWSWNKKVVAWWYQYASSTLKASNIVSIEYTIRPNTWPWEKPTK